MLIFVAEVWQAMKLELAAIGGNVEARYNVGRTEALVGNIVPIKALYDCCGGWI